MPRSRALVAALVGRCPVLGSVFGLAFCAGSAGAAPPRYRLEMLPRPAGFMSASSKDISDSGYVVVEYQTSAGVGTTAFIHDPDGTVHQLGSMKHVYGVNNQGDAGGSRGDGVGEAMLYSAGGAHTATLPVGLTGGAVAAVTDGLIWAAGYGVDPGGATRAVLWIDSLPVAPITAGVGSGFLDVSPRGHAVGWIDRPTTTNGIYYDGAEMQEVPNPFEGTPAQLKTLNNVGGAAGWGFSAVAAFPGFQGGQQGFMYDSTTRTVTPLGFVGPWGYLTQPFGMNDAGQIVGFGLYQEPGKAAKGVGFLWESGVMYNLNDLVVNKPAGSVIIAAGAINNGGIIAADVVMGTTRSIARLTRVCPADLVADGIVDFTDYLEFLTLFAGQSPRVDFNDDGIVDFADYLEFLNHYEAGC